MLIKQFRYSLDNLGYLIYSGNEAVAVDGGAVDQIRTFIKDNGLTLKYAVHTHSHADHTMGTRDLLKKAASEFLDYRRLLNEKSIWIDNQEIQILHTPGHTQDSVSFYTGTCLITGDTLFNGTVGNCFSGDLEAFYRSIRLLLSFPDDTVIYAGHDYVKASMAVARQFEPDNPDILLYLKKYNPGNVCSALADERKVNPYIRFNRQSIVDTLKEKGLAVETELERFCSVMTL